MVKINIFFLKTCYQSIKYLNIFFYPQKKARSENLNQVIIYYLIVETDEINY